jgi:hypothetical protein
MKQRERRIMSCVLFRAGVSSDVVLQELVESLWNFFASTRGDEIVAGGRDDKPFSVLPLPS